MLLTAPAAAADIKPGATIAGEAVALDGDTLLVDGQTVRLWGIEAPEMKDWPYGAWARAELDRVIADKIVTCTVVDRDRYQRLVAICNAPYRNDQVLDLALEQLGSGVAVMYRHFTHGAGRHEGPMRKQLDSAARLYATWERLAAERQLGIWQGRSPPERR